MILQVNCPYCSLLLNVDSTTLTGPVQCCGCHHTFMVAGAPAPMPTVQARPAAPAPQAAPPQTQAPRPPGPRAPAPPAKPSPRAPFPAGNRAGAERKAASAKQDSEWMGYALIAVVLLAGGAAIYAGVNWLSDFQAKAKNDEYALPQEFVEAQEAQRKAWQEGLRQQEAEEAEAREQMVARLSQYVCGGNDAVASQLMTELEAVQQEIDSLRTDASSDNDPKDLATYFKTSLAQRVAKNGVLFHWLGGKPPTVFGDLLFGTRARPAERGQVADFLVAGNYSSTGTGFFISADGWLLTSEHVVAGAKEVEFRDAKGVIRKARVVKTSPEQDLALLKAEPSPAPAAPSWMSKPWPPG
jgi:hypothetical protein